MITHCNESQEYNSCTIMSESQESSVSRKQASRLDVKDVINLDSDEDSIGQLDNSGTQLDDEYVELNMHANEHPSIDEQSSSGSSEVQLAVVGSRDFGNIVQHKIHHNDHQKLTLLKKHFVPASDYKFPTRTINGIHRHIHQHFQHSWLSRYPGLVYSK